MESMEICLTAIFLTDEEMIFIKYFALIYRNIINITNLSTVHAIVHCQNPYVRKGDTKCDPNPTAFCNEEKYPWLLQCQMKAPNPDSQKF